MGITFEQAKSLKHGDVLHFRDSRNTDGSCARWRVNGKVKTWKRHPTQVKVPLKHGLRDHEYLTEGLLHLVHFEADCPWEKFKQAKASGDLTILPTLLGLDDKLDKQIAKVLR